MLVQQEIHEPFVQELARRTARLRLGAGLDDPDVGPIISEEQFQRVLKYLEVGKEERAEIVAGGTPATEVSLRQGFFVKPTLFDAVQPHIRIAQEKIFGQVLSILPFRDVEEAVEIANGVSYGLVTAIWTRDIGKAHRLAAQIKAGQVFINNYFGGRVATPFGGYKKSGFGREKDIEALLSYTQVKNVCVMLD